MNKYKKKKHTLDVHLGVQIWDETVQRHIWSNFWIFLPFFFVYHPSSPPLTKTYFHAAIFLLAPVFLSVIVFSSWQSTSLRSPCVDATVICFSRGPCSDRSEPLTLCLTLSWRRALAGGLGSGWEASPESHHSFMQTSYALWYKEFIVGLSQGLRL